MRYTDNMVRQVKEDLHVPFECIMVLENLPAYVTDAAVIADLPQFQCAYFTAEELSPLSLQLENFCSSPFFCQYLKQLLTPEKKGQIRQVLKSVIENNPLPQQVKQAFALYITLDDELPWHKHPFILRLFYNSYWHWRVQTTV